ncbi:unnamed protein product [Onchocerca flexuosa]|uniref:Uncharacterized protein n=1 Tax=Onchocerca flexuosa TaxID=387005 RepID=A0A183H8N4_9BILA|nr:unnamed protein product [Onchocerca flexuosa]
MSDWGQSRILKLWQCYIGIGDYVCSSLSPYSTGHTPYCNNSSKNISVNGVCRSLKEKTNTERSSVLKTKETKENSRADASRSRAVTETAAIPWISNSPNGYVGNTDLVHKERNSSSRDTEKEQNCISPCAAPLQTTANSENDCDWFLVQSEKAVDERSEAGLSDTSAPPEWADGPAIMNGKFFYLLKLCFDLPRIHENIDEEFNALADAAERLFLSEKKSLTQLGGSPPSPITTVHPMRSEQKKNLQKKQEASSINGKKILGPVGSQRNHGKQNSNRPSAFIEQLQKERKLAEDQYLRNKRLKGEKEEVWPGFNLKLPTLSEYFCDRDYDKQENNESVWQVPPVSTNNNWPPAPANDFVQQRSISTDANSYLAEAVRAFRLNPEAPPFIIENSSNFHSRPISLAAGPVFPPPNPTSSHRQKRSDFVHGMHHPDTYIDDPLGLSGSLFGRGSANIWANDPHSASGVTSQDNKSELDPNSAAVYWTEMFLADEEKKKCP